MNGIEVACEGRIGKLGELRTSQGGKPWCSMSIVVGKDDGATWLSVVVFGEQAEAIAKLEKGARVYVEGRLTLNTWKAPDGTDRTGLKVTAFTVQPMGQIGHRKPARASGKAKASGNEGARGHLSQRIYAPSGEVRDQGRDFGDAEIPF